jgi:hypothetical protein
MKNKGLLVTLGAVAASMEGIFHKPLKEQKNSTEPQKPRGKSKGGRKGRGFLQGLPRVAAGGTALGNGAWKVKGVNLYKLAAPNWHSENKRTKPRKVK